MTSWLNTDPVTWRKIAAGYPQSCPDDCGNRIEVGTLITDAPGVWRRVDCAKREWLRYDYGVISGTEAELTAAIKRVSRLGGYVVARSWNPERVRNARFHWTEVVPETEEKEK